MKKILKHESKEDENGNIYGITHVEETIFCQDENGDDMEYVQQSFRITKTYIHNDITNISEQTKNIIDDIKNKGKQK
jgi:hypothetical protein